MLGQGKNISPINFTTIGGNPISGPALMGNVVLWKPSASNVYASTIVYKILLEAGLLPDVFRSPSARVGDGIGKQKYREFPRLVGETSGKNFALVHASADIPSAVNHTVRGAFKYQG